MDCREMEWKIENVSVASG